MFAAVVAFGSACGATKTTETGPFNHPSNFGEPAVHGPAAEANLSLCQSCHAADFSGAVGPSCNACHLANGFANWATNCTFCHNSGTPVQVYNASSLPLAGPGATHQDHLTGGAFTNGVTCDQCHVVPTDLGHVGSPVTVTFGSVATTGGLNPTYTSSTQTCSNVYCHGGQGSQIAWTGSVSCGSCHAIPPVDPGTPVDEHAWHVTDLGGPQLDCGKCHPGYTATTANKPLHVDGIIEVISPTTSLAVTGWHCAACHTGF